MEPHFATSRILQPVAKCGWLQNAAPYQNETLTQNATTKKFSSLQLYAGVTNGLLSLGRARIINQ